MNAHTLSTALLASLRPAGSSLTVREMVERLKRARADWRRLGSEEAAPGSAREYQIGDEMSELDARIDILTIAITAAIDAALEPIGLTWAEVKELEL